MGEAAVDVDSIAQRHHFLIRRLHSLSGLVPIGVFLVVHLSVNATINVGGEEFQRNVDRIHALGPLLVPVEILGIFLPILFHAVLGLHIWLSGQPNVGTYRYGGNVRYTLQRVTGGIAFVFILYHVWHMHWLGKGLGGGFFDPEAGRAAITAAESMRHTIFGFPVSILYAIGVLSTVYHLANGIWTSLITWGVTIGPSSQRIAGYVCAVFGVVLGIAGLSAVKGFKEFQGDSVLADAPLDVGSSFVTTTDHPE
ncbi:MAG: succinate dehydrogenase cytochrome b558 subunit [Phycisphaerae bacterium]